MRRVVPRDQRISELEAQLGDATQEIARLRESTTQLKDELGGAMEEIARLQARIEELEVRLMRNWQRLDDNITSKIAVTVPGGWADESTFDLTVATAVSTMKRFYNSLEKRAKAATDAAE